MSVVTIFVVGIVATAATTAAATATAAAAATAATTATAAAAAAAAAVVVVIVPPRTLLRTFGTHLNIQITVFTLRSVEGEHRCIALYLISHCLSGLLLGRHRPFLSRGERASRGCHLTLTLLLQLTFLCLLLQQWWGRGFFGVGW